MTVRINTQVDINGTMCEVEITAEWASEARTELAILEGEAGKITDPSPGRDDPNPKPKRTRRTKAQKEADERAAQQAQQATQNASAPVVGSPAGVPPAAAMPSADLMGTQVEVTSEQVLQAAQRLLTEKGGNPGDAGYVKLFEILQGVGAQSVGTLAKEQYAHVYQAIQKAL